MGNGLANLSIRELDLVAKEIHKSQGRGALCVIDDSLIYIPIEDIENQLDGDLRNLIITMVTCYKLGKEYVYIKIKNDDLEELDIRRI